MFTITTFAITLIITLICLYISKATFAAAMNSDNALFSTVLIILFIPFVFMASVGILAIILGIFSMLLPLF